MTLYAYTILLNQISTLVHIVIMLKHVIPWYVLFGNNHVLWLTTFLTKLP
jgi:hypothetical protein